MNTGNKGKASYSPGEVLSAVLSDPLTQAAQAAHTLLPSWMGCPTHWSSSLP